MIPKRTSANHTSRSNTAVHRLIVVVAYRQRVFEKPWLNTNNTHQLHRRNPNEPVSLAKLRQLGVVSWNLDADNHKTDPKLAAIRKVRGYTYEVCVNGVRVGCCVHAWLFRTYGWVYDALDCGV